MAGATAIFMTSEANPLRADMMSASIFEDGVDFSAVQMPDMGAAFESAAGWSAEAGGFLANAAADAANTVGGAAHELAQATPGALHDAGQWAGGAAHEAGQWGGDAAEAGAALGEGIAEFGEDLVKSCCAIL